jgi:hypothetical protein
LMGEAKKSAKVTRLIAMSRITPAMSRRMT